MKLKGFNFLIAVLSFVIIIGCEGKPPFLSNSYLIPVLHSLTVGQMIDAGNYNCNLAEIDSVTIASCLRTDLRTKMQAPDIKRCDVSFRCVLVAFDRPAYTEEVIGELNKKGLRPARLDELLFFEAEYPNEQKIFPIVALGSGCSGDGIQKAAFVSEYNNKNSSSKILTFAKFGTQWGGICRFLAIEK